ncbi:DUF4192 domain-containing protein [Nocardiopsis ansamitocini]|uniref:DUF4192 domain-containing protein n=1 Tax=Nocardiopsis ansamitocini TaxID=1670832 RepID=A0A9W6P6E7_9ACTN|nr:DUF4192 domain-containing protein [Nocardiopsis ansamitocini]GLU47919.1 hypothetical protein Nans01_22700 [Nocardiopsis ansamitocini]
MAVHETPPSPSPLRLRTPVDLLAAVPYLIGFQPEHGLVVLGITEPNESVAFIAGDALPPDPAAGSTDPADRLAALFVQENCRYALIVGYGSPEHVTPCAAALRGRLAALDVLVLDALRLHQGRYWSYTCTSAACCPPEGRPYAPEDSPVPSAALAAGFRAGRPRAESARLLEPVTGESRRSMSEAIRSAEARGARYRSISDTAFPTEGSRAVRRAIAALLAGQGPPRSHDETGWLGVALTDLRVRDEAWAAIDAPCAARHVRLWSHVLRRVDAGYAAAPASLVAFAAWQDGDPILAHLALDVALAAHPGYPMATLVRQALWANVSPARWRPLRSRGPVGSADGRGVSGAPERTL